MEYYNTNALPCPFCGSKRIFVGFHGGGFEARCTDCGVSTKRIDWSQAYYDDQRQPHYNRDHDAQVERGKELALRDWNRRVNN